MGLVSPAALHLTILTLLRNATQVVGYGFCHVPTTAGSSEVECCTWRPMGSISEEVAAFFVGGIPRLADDEVMFSKAWEQRCRLLTIGSGTVHLRLDVVLKNFEQNCVDWT